MTEGPLPLRDENVLLAGVVEAISAGLELGPQGPGQRGVAELVAGLPQPPGEDPGAAQQLHGGLAHGQAQQRRLDVARDAAVLEAGGILEQVPDGIVLISPNLSILWANQRLYTLTGRKESLIGRNFYEAFGTPEILGPDFCPFNTALGSGESARDFLYVDDAAAAFFLQVQGLGRVKLPDGKTIRVAYDGQNGHLYTAVGRVLVDRGQIPRS